MKNVQKEIEYVSGLISIIVPVYNVKDYLNRCIDSILAQTYTNLEILLIDDGSTDGSGQICDEYKDKDKRVRVFHKTNGGASTARNLGLDKAKGEFIGFVDSDDYIKADMYASLCKYMEKEVDIVCCGTALLFPTRMHKPVKLFGKLKTPSIYSNQQAVKELLLVRDLTFSSWNKVYKRKLFQGIRFPEGKICEDYPVIYQVIKKSRKVVNSGEVKYFHCYRADSISKRQFHIRRMSYVLFTRDIFRDVIAEYPNERKCGEALYIRSIVDTIRKIEECDEKDRYVTILRRLKKLLLRMCGNIALNPYIPRATKRYVREVLFRRPIW